MAQQYSKCENIFAVSQRAEANTGHKLWRSGGWTAPAELPPSSKNVPTFYSNRQNPKTATRQLDFVFASEDIANRVRATALNQPDEWGPSDHCRIMIEIKWTYLLGHQNSSLLRTSTRLRINHAESVTILGLPPNAPPQTGERKHAHQHDWSHAGQTRTARFILWGSRPGSLYHNVCGDLFFALKPKP